MTSKTRKLTDDEIEVEVLATRDDPSAWEALPVVPSAASQRPQWAVRERHLQLAAKFHVLSMLYIHGAEADVLWSQPDRGADIIVFNRRGEALTIEVKTITNESIWQVDRFAAVKHHFVVLVDYSRISRQTDLAPDVYIVASEILRDFVASRSNTRIAIAALNSELHVRNAWQALLADAA
jgi:hypothetical protein